MVDFNRLMSTYLFICFWIGRWEEPEEQARLPVGCIGQEASVTLSNIEWDLWEM
jgi:hypothetical protein